MAPNGHTSAGSRSADRSVKGGMRASWLKRRGSAEFKNWQTENPTQLIDYDGWKDSEHVEGLSLYYAAMQIWDETDSSEAEVEQLKVESRPRAVRAQSTREPKKTVKINGNGLSRSVGSATPSGPAHSEDVNLSGQKKRKQKKKFLSEEIVASDDSENIDATTSLAEATSPSAPTITVNGRRKSSNRKPRKKPISEETISPEDEVDDPMALNGIVTPAIASPLPVRSAPKPPAKPQSPQPVKKYILKLSTRKPPKKKVMSAETVLDDDTEEDHTSAAAASPNVAATAEPSITATTPATYMSIASTVARSSGADPAPSPSEESAAATRRGLRARRPAQQRPYSYDVDIFEGSESDGIEEQPVAQSSPMVPSRRVSVASLGTEPLGQLDPETLAILQGAVDPEPEDEMDNQRRPKHFKGKGRAWKKEESDEDVEFNPTKKKNAARAKAKAKAQAQAQQQQPKKRGRPRKSGLSEDVIRDDSEGGSPAQTMDASPSPAALESSTKKTRKPTRKSVLSEAIVRDDSDDLETAGSSQAAPAVMTLEVSSPAPRKRGRPRKSDQSMSSKEYDDSAEAISYTPEGTPNKSYTPKGEPKQTVAANEFSAASGNATQPESKKESAPPTPSGIEAHMASVNADDDDDEMELCKLSKAALSTSY